MTNPTNTTGKTSQPQQDRSSSVKPQQNEAGKKPATSGSQTDKNQSSDKM